jgi:hypothetical protein
MILVVHEAGRNDPEAGSDMTEHKENQDEEEQAFES